MSGKEYRRKCFERTANFEYFMSVPIYFFIIFFKIAASHRIVRALYTYLKLRIFLARPECAAGSVVQQLAGAPGGDVRARCSVTAPTSRDAGPLRFYWTYNSTRDVLPVLLSHCFSLLVCIIDLRSIPVVIFIFFQHPLSTDTCV